MQIQSRSTHWKFITIIVVVLLLGMSNIWAGTSGKIAGRFYDQDTGEALPGANVMVEGTNMGTSSDIDGRYFIINVPPGTYVLKASFMGHEGMVVTDVRVTIDRTTEIDFPMTINVLEGAEVTITATRPLVDKDLTGSRQMISADDMDQSWARDLSEVVEMQSGVSDGHFRGGTMTESVYLLDNISLNSGLMSDNYTAINPTTIEEVVVLTGGYNAEYGNAQSAIVNAVTREVSSGYEATLVTRMRPAGKYHWGRNLYSEENADIADYGLDYWTAQVGVGGEYEGQDADALLAQYKSYTTADDIQKNYAERAEYETEATIVGALTPKIGYMVSGRFKRGVNVFPQALEYNPEHNIQGKISYKVSDQSKLTFSGLVGGYETANYSSSNFNSIENSQEMAWSSGSMITDPYSG
ncbi:MAG: TonB-dependent receptor, partial [Bacteroidetes bacterium]|nr:TonB-dependent receptor [Bacteroidota bacterium]